MNRRPRLTVPRPVAMFLPPVLALLLAAAYTQFQATQAETAAHALCDRFGPGAAIAPFVHEALAAEFEVRDEGAGSTTLVAVRSVYRLRQEEYRCTISHDGARVRAASVSRVELE